MNSSEEEEEDFLGLWQPSFLYASSSSSPNSLFLMLILYFVSSFSSELRAR